MSLFSSKRERECGTVFESSRNFPKLGEYSRVWLKTENLCRWKEIHYIKDALPDIGSNIQHSDSTILVFMDPCEVAPGVEAPVILWPENETLLGSHLGSLPLRQLDSPNCGTLSRNGSFPCAFSPINHPPRRRRQLPIQSFP